MILIVSLSSRPIVGADHTTRPARFAPASGRHADPQVGLHLRARHRQPRLLHRAERQRYSGEEMINIDIGDDMTIAEFARTVADVNEKGAILSPFVPAHSPPRSRSFALAERGAETQSRNIGSCCSIRLDRTLALDDVQDIPGTERQDGNEQQQHGESHRLFPHHRLQIFHDGLPKGRPSPRATVSGCAPLHKAMWLPVGTNSPWLVRVNPRRGS